MKQSITVAKIVTAAAVPTAAPTAGRTGGDADITVVAVVDFVPTYIDVVEYESIVDS